MIDDPKDAAHRLLFEQRDKLQLLDEETASRDVEKLCQRLLSIIDVLELQIRRIDELESKETK